MRWFITLLWNLQNHTIILYSLCTSVSYLVRQNIPILSFSPSPEDHLGRKNGLPSPVAPFYYYFILFNTHKKVFILLFFYIFFFLQLCPRIMRDTTTTDRTVGGSPTRRTDRFWWSVNVETIRDAELYTYTHTNSYIHSLYYRPYLTAITPHTHTSFEPCPFCGSPYFTTLETKLNLITVIFGRI